MSARRPIERPAVFAPWMTPTTPVPADAGMHLDAELAQPLRYERGRAVLLETDLRMRVQIAPQRGQSLVVRKDRRPAGRAVQV